MRGYDPLWPPTACAVVSNHARVAMRIIGKYDRFIGILEEISSLSAACRGRDPRPGGHAAGGSPAGRVGSAEQMRPGPRSGTQVGGPVEVEYGAAGPLGLG